MPLHSLFPEFILTHPRDLRPRKYETPGSGEQKPRTRRSATKGTPSVSQKLPDYSGPYDVGCVDIEVPVSNPRTFTNFTRKKTPLLQLDTVLMALFYPAELANVDRKQLKKPRWLGDSRNLTAKGYAHFASVPDYLLGPFLRSTTWRTQLAAYEHPPVSDRWPGTENVQEPFSRKEKPIFPLVLFSHGLGGTRRAYSTLCGEYASYGFVVCAIEHRDGSAPRTLVMRKPAVPSSKEPLERVHTSKATAEDYDVVDFVFPRSDPHDTSPGHDVDKELRQGQIAMRSAEVQEAYKVLTMLCRGEGSLVAAANLRPLENTQDYNWAGFKDRFHLDHVTMIGHSFGAATATHILREISDYPYISQGIIYDIWGGPVRERDDEAGIQVQTPILGINSEAFTSWPPNFTVAQNVIREALDQDLLAWLLTVRGSVHINQSDFCILFPHITRGVFKATIDPVHAIDLNMDASLDFLTRTLAPKLPSDEQPPFMAIIQEQQGQQQQQLSSRSRQQHLLDQKYLTQLPTTSNPEKHVALRPKVSDSVRRKVRWTLTPSGRRKLLEGIDEAARQEVWIHLGPRCPPPDHGGMETASSQTKDYAEAPERGKDQPEIPVKSNEKENPQIPEGGQHQQHQDTK